MGDILKHKYGYDKYAEEPCSVQHGNWCTLMLWITKEYKAKYSSIN